MSVLKALNEAFYPTDIKCIICDAELSKSTRYMLCEDCKPCVNTHFCESCGRGMGGEAHICDECMNKRNAFSAARSAFVFSEDVARLVYRFKYANARYLSSAMAEFILDVFYETKWDIDFVTFVPLHKKRQKQRGYNQAQLLAQEFCAMSGLKLETLLEKVAYTKNMAKLSGQKRQQLIAGTFAPIGSIDLKGKRVLLVDDVLTTGATANECAKQLLKTCAEVFVLTFASVKKKQQLSYNLTKKETKKEMRKIVDIAKIKGYNNSNN